MLKQNSYGFLEYSVTKNDMILAKERLDRNFKLGRYTLNSKTVYQGEEYRIGGILGEVVFQRLFGNRAVQSPETDITYDFIINGKKIDVKCKCRNVPPKPEFEASIFAYQLNKHFDLVDVYCFMSTTKSFETVWVCGYLGKNEWKDNPNGRLWKAGEVDPSNNVSCKKDTYSVKYKYLEKFMI